MNRNNHIKEVLEAIEYVIIIIIVIIIMPRFYAKSRCVCVCLGVCSGRKKWRRQFAHNARKFFLLYICFDSRWFVSNTWHSLDHHHLIVKEVKRGERKRSIRWKTYQVSKSATRVSIIVVSVIQTLKVLFVVVNWIHNWWFVCCFWLIIHVITKVSYYLLFLCICGCFVFLKVAQRYLERIKRNTDLIRGLARFGCL